MASAGLTSAGQELMNIWNEMDRGALKDDEGFEEADKAGFEAGASLLRDAMAKRGSNR